MKKFLLKSLIFIFPFAILQAITILGHRIDHGDLTRIGNIIELYPNYRENLWKDQKFDVHFKELESIDVENLKIKYLLIGDSFTFDGNGYKNQLGSLSNESVYSFHMKLLVDKNPLQTLSALIKTDFFKKNEVEYVILQSVERFLTLRANTFDKTIDHDFTNKVERKSLESNHFKLSDREFPSKSIFKIPYMTTKYVMGYENLDRIYRFDTDKNYFSVDKNEVLVFREDVDFAPLNNNPLVIDKLNNILNDLQSELDSYGIQMIFLPAPDKMTAYYDLMITKDKYVKPNILKELANYKQKYTYINTLSIIDRFHKENKKDFYYYDDTHWSFKGAKEVASAVLQVAN